jgi:hypothetical protein
MALPERRHFDIESAAKYLGCSVSDLRYYLDEGMLRLAFPTRELWAVDTIAHEELSQSLQDAINRLPDPPDRSDLKKIKRKERDVAHCPEFLYISGYHRKTALERIGESGRGIYYFETLEGQLVNIWDYGSLSYWWVYPREDGELSETILPREELDRFKRETELESEPELKPQPQPHLPDLPFKSPQKPNEVSIVMVDYGNRFFEENKRTPNPTELINFLLLHSEKIGFRIRTDDEMENGTGDAKKRYDFNGAGLSERQFKDRFKTYSAVQ